MPAIRARGDGRAWGGEIGTRRSGGGAVVGALKDIRRPEIIRGRAGMPTTARSENPRAAITKRASAASSARASMAGGDTCSGEAFVSQPRLSRRAVRHCG
jgi:hypothetical protein